MPKPILIYDGDCRFCRIWVDYWKSLAGDVVGLAPSQEVASRFPQIPQQAFESSVQLVLPDGKVVGGAEAVFRVLQMVPGRRWLLGAYERLPGFRPLSEWAYRLAAGHRQLSYRLTCWLWGKRIRPSSAILSRWIFLRCLGLIYLIAFASLRGQLPGLIGDHGILPAADYLVRIERQFGAGSGHFWYFPTLAWIRADDGFLQLLSSAGAALSLLVVIGAFTVPALVLLWVLYLSLLTVGQDFLAFQWDILLLEVGFLTIFLAPRQLRPHLSEETPPAPIFVWLSRLLLFRLMISSGAVKLLSGDPTWRNLTALTYHYETQPLPTPIAWYAHQLPAWFHQLSAAGIFAIELIAPLLFFGPRRLRFAAGGLTIFSQLLIAATGNYTYFNLLTIALCLLLFDDLFWSRFLPARAWRAIRERGAAAWTTNASPARKAVTVLLLALSLIQLLGLLVGPGNLPYPLPNLYGLFSPLHIVNSYGLFAVMTTTRQEIIIEGSNDGETWSAYRFKYKPQDPRRALAWVAPYQPRLDWQMWFAALGNYRMNPWFINLGIRLLEGRHEVLRLLANNPFPDRPPLYVRASLYLYRFTDRATRRAEGTVWRRQYQGLYMPPISLRVAR
ncbi:MAG: lipase maturation factor family protein [Acidobacteriota bacterium]